MNPKVQQLAAKDIRITRNVTLINHTDCTLEVKMLAGCLAKAATYLVDSNCSGIDLTVAARVPMDAPIYKHPGWLEYVLTIKYADNTSLEIHCIQRKPHLDIEFCT